ncbi:MAG TPA: radical SAM protein [Candidatus Hypogeohydataceae bacterium YC38]
MDFTWATRKSKFIHYFDKTPPGVVCPHFYVLSHANGCPYDCSYCYLQLTFRHRPGLRIFQNSEDLAREVKDWLSKTERPSLLNAGELSDGLATDHITGLSKFIVPLFRGQDRHKLLFLTKSTNIQNLLAVVPTPQVVVSFSINAPEVSKMFEPAAPDPLERLEAARTLIKGGWRVRLRIDPIVPIEDWQKIYGRLADSIPTEVETITLGSLRYFRALPNYSHRGKEIFKYASLKDGTDNRIRIERNLRLEIYKFLIQKFTAANITCKIGLCKETQEVHDILGLAGNRQSCNCTVD